MSKKISIVVFLVVAFVLVVSVAAIAGFMDRKDAGSSQASTSGPIPSTSQPNVSAVSAATTTPSYTLADVAKHSTGTSCWTAINGSVYDVTAWISQHPGGPEHILSLCGTDGSAAFNGQHGGEARPAEELATFKIGTLSN